MPDKSYFQELRELESLVNTGRLVQKFLPKQADIDKILKVIQQEVLKGTHLSITIKDILAGYLISSYFKDIYLYLAKNKLPSTKSVIRKVETLIKTYLTINDKFFIPNLIHYLRSYIKGCHICQLTCNEKLLTRQIAN